VSGWRATLPNNPATKAGDLPCCKSYDAQMWPASMAPADTPDRDKPTFECPRYQEETVEIVGYK